MEEGALGGWGWESQPCHEGVLSLSEAAHRILFGEDADDIAGLLRAALVSWVRREICGHLTFGSVEVLPARRSDHLYVVVF